MDLHGSVARAAASLDGHLDLGRAAHAEREELAATDDTTLRRRAPTDAGLDRG
jgi:hypothetical protein